ncbi:hypothetical protein OVA24_17915 [Luteolibacter sp. SL250]|uniref:hypothetical protein n=1 Tax=Luteolibacter sp. SL250 TaxID=2995170 RepID=UPI00226E1223|nr:hypothetical protein [Luteolibacter sp. SL250]WAC19106.1 hypothetical protein OVA24_17915 [Luteolibacter sp. SL250]
MSAQQKPPATVQAEPDCFVIMPIADCDGYPKGHFQHVFDGIIKPACKKAGFNGFRADQVKQSNLIHLDILQRLLEAPMAVCDLSSRNPNVLFELALRQAFDKPVCLIQEVGTAPIFDISPLRYIEYRRERIYHEVLEDQTKIAESIEATHAEHAAGKGINSIVKLLALSKPASLPEISAPEASTEFQQLILLELSQLRDEFRVIRRETSNRRSARNEMTAERATFRDMMRQAETMVVTSMSHDDFKRALMFIDNCRHTWANLCKSFSPEDRDFLIEYDSQIDFLRARATEHLERLNSQRARDERSGNSTDSRRSG